MAVAQSQSSFEDVHRGLHGQPEVLLPGEGEAHPDCGIVAPNQFCDGDDAHVHFGRHRCGRRECPECWSSEWAGPRTTNVVQRLAAARYAEPDGPQRRILHVSINPPDGVIASPTDMFEARSRATDLAKEHGVRGGVMLVHPYRATDEAKQAFAEAKEAGFEGGIWRFIRENDRYWYAQVRWSPHYHVIGLCRDFEAATDQEWTVQNMSTGIGVDPNPEVDRRFAPLRDVDTPAADDAYEDMISVVRYLLSHTASVDNRMSVTWFGEAHATNFAPEDDITTTAWRTIKRRVEQLVGSGDDRPDEEDDLDEDQECPVDGCDGYLHHITDVPDYIDQRGDALSIEAVTRLRTAYDWFIGNDEEAPMGGWPRPRTEAAAREAFDEL